MGWAAQPVTEGTAQGQQSTNSFLPLPELTATSKSFELSSPKERSNSKWQSPDPCSAAFYFKGTSLFLGKVSQWLGGVFVGGGSTSTAGILCLPRKWCTSVCWIDRSVSSSKMLPIRRVCFKSGGMCLRLSKPSIWVFHPGAEEICFHGPGGFRPLCLMSLQDLCRHSVFA